MRVYTVTLHELVCKFALQRRKSKTIILIAFQQKLNEVIAESANAVVKHDWIGVRRQDITGNSDVR